MCRAPDACHRSQKSQVLRQRIDSVIECLTYDVFRQSVNSFYEVDRVVFTLLLALHVDLHASNITRQELVTFIRCTSTRFELNLLSVCIVTIIFVVSVCLSVCLCRVFFSAVFDPISIKLGHLFYVWV